MRGRRVRSLRALVRLASQKRAVTGEDFVFHARYLPAAFVVGMPALKVFRLISCGMWEYKSCR